MTGAVEGQKMSDPQRGSEAKTYDVVTLGEAMLRLSPPPGLSLTRTTSLDVHVAGAEANVAVSLAQLGRSVAFLSVVPDSRLGRRVVRDLAAAGVDVSGVRWTSVGRLGLYFVELDGGPRGVSIVYDRAGSAASTMTPDQVDWPKVHGARIVHLSGITAALSAGCRDTALEVARVAKQSKSLLSIDVNYRSKLWTTDEARTVISSMARGADVVVCTREDARDVFGIDGSPEAAADRLARLIGSRTVVVTDGAAGAVLCRDGSVSAYPAAPSVIRDRLGAGDAFVAGLLDGLLDGDPQAGMQRGAVLAGVALASVGDQVDLSRAELNAATHAGPRTVDR